MDRIWNCEACTYGNPAGRTICQMCNTTKPKLSELPVLNDKDISSLMSCFNCTREGAIKALTQNGFDRNRAANFLVSSPTSIKPSSPTKPKQNVKTFIAPKPRPIKHIDPKLKPKFDSKIKPKPDVDKKTAKERPKFVYNKISNSQRNQKEDPVSVSRKMKASLAALERSQINEEKKEKAVAKSTTKNEEKKSKNEEKKEKAVAKTTTNIKSNNTKKINKPDIKERNINTQKKELSEKEKKEKQEKAKKMLDDAKNERERISREGRLHWYIEKERKVAEAMELKEKAERWKIERENSFKTIDEISKSMIESTSLSHCHSVLRIIISIAKKFLDHPDNINLRSFDIHNPAFIKNIMSNVGAFGLLRFFGFILENNRYILKSIDIKKSKSLITRLESEFKKSLSFLYPLLTTSPEYKSTPDIVLYASIHLRDLLRKIYENPSRDIHQQLDLQYGPGLMIYSIKPTFICLQKIGFIPYPSQPNKSLWLETLSIENSEMKNVLIDIDRFIEENSLETPIALTLKKLIKKNGIESVFIIAQRMAGVLNRIINNINDSKFQKIKLSVFFKNALLDDGHELLHVCGFNVNIKQGFAIYHGSPNNVDYFLIGDVLNDLNYAVQNLLYL